MCTLVPGSVRYSHLCSEHEIVVSLSAACFENKLFRIPRASPSLGSLLYQPPRHQHAQEKHNKYLTYSNSVEHVCIEKGRSEWALSKVCGMGRRLLLPRRALPPAAKCNNQTKPFLNWPRHHCAYCHHYFRAIWRRWSVMAFYCDMPAVKVAASGGRRETTKRRF